MSIKKNILVTGGLGFIGSHTVISLNEAGFNPIIIDNLSNSKYEVLDVISDLIGVKPIFINGDVNDKELMHSIFYNYKPEAVIHFAAFKSVGESAENPLIYYQNNVGGVINLLEVMKSFDCKKLVFSSSCTVYGEPESIPVKETSITKPALSPYGATKQIAEIILKDNNWCSVQCLRYFNPVGAHSSFKLGESPLNTPNNLIPFLTQTVAGIRDKLIIFGNDYDTLDGTCIRDYIHVVDLAEAHVASLNRLFLNKRNYIGDPGDPSNENFEVFNLGTGIGYTVLQVISTFESITGKKVKFEIGDRRSGDIVAIWADTNKVNNKLGWSAKRDLSSMMRDAWNWQLNNNF